MNADDLLYAPVNGPSLGSPSNTIYDPTLRILSLPDSWVDTIERIRRCMYSEATIAGGALRDFDQGRPVKDVDIFLPGNVMNTCELVEQSINHQRPGQRIYIDEILHDPNHHSAISNGIPCPSHFQFVIDGWKFEITQKFEPFTHRTIIDSFDLGICMICLDGNTVYRAPEYLDDAANKRITIVRPTGGRELLHAQRISRKYPDWTIVE